MFNRSQSPYLVCYHGPRLIIERYGFNVELIVQTQTSMHGSSECHMGYIYRRVTAVGDEVKKGKRSLKTDTRVTLEQGTGIVSDPLFVNAWNSTRRELVPMMNDVQAEVLSNLSSRRPSRPRKAKSN